MWKYVCKSYKRSHRQAVVIAIEMAIGLPHLCAIRDTIRAPHSCSIWIPHFHADAITIDCAHFNALI